MSSINNVLKWLKKEFHQMSFYVLLCYLFLAFWVVFIEVSIQGLIGLLTKLFFEMTGILAIVELLKRLFPNINWEDKEKGN